MEKKNKISCIIIVSLFICSFFIGVIPFRANNEQKDDLDDIERIILFSFDSCNPEYFSSDYLPKIYELLKEEGVMYKNAWAPLASETMNGHTTMLTGCLSNSTGIIGNGFYDHALGKEVENPVQDPDFRDVKTVFEDLDDHHSKKAEKTGFVSGKWRLPDFLAYGAEYVFASPKVKEFEICPKDYEALLGMPIMFADGDVYDQWIMRALTELVKKDDPEFIFVNLAWCDVSGHDTGSFNENHKRHLQQLDDLLWQFVNDLKEMNKYKTTLFIFTSDHGMDTITDVFNPKAYLEQNGIEVEHIHEEGESGFIFLEHSDDTNKAVKLLKQNDKVAVVIPRDEMYKIAMNTTEDRTGQIYISCKESIACTLSGLDFSLIGTHGGVSARDVPLAFLGPGIKEGEFIQETIPGLEDIVPTIYDIWGYSIPDYMDGESVLDEIRA